MFAAVLLVLVVLRIRLATRLRATLAEAEAGGPESLADITILTPTRRAGRALIEAFAAERGGRGAAILPMIRPIGDIDADEPPFEPGELADAAPPAIDPARRHFELTRLILAREEAAGRTMTLGAAMARPFVVRTAFA